jgi:hypothetical protein
MVVEAGLKPRLKADLKVRLYATFYLLLTFLKVRLYATLLLTFPLFHFSTFPLALL